MAVHVAAAAGNTNVAAGSTAVGCSIADTVVAVEGSTAGAESCIAVAIEDDSEAAIVDFETDLDRGFSRYDRPVERIISMFRCEP